MNRFPAVFIFLMCCLLSVDLPSEFIVTAAGIMCRVIAINVKLKKNHSRAENTFRKKKHGPCFKVSAT